ncbi:hypothetical protein BH23PLA1_BH23PLA1_35640 [soil metagenome]
MNRSSPPDPSPTRPEDSPIAWFGEMLLAADRRDFERAAEAQRQLSRLGWTVKPARPRQRPQGTEAAR